MSKKYYADQILEVTTDAGVTIDSVVVKDGGLTLTTALPIASGGTGATTAEQARTNLGAISSALEARTSDLSVSSDNNGKAWMRSDSAVPLIKAIVQYDTETSVMTQKVFNAANTGCSNYTFRMAIPASAITASGSTIKVKFKAYGTGPLVVDHASIVERASGADGTTTPTELLFGGASGFDCSAGQIITSDALTYALDETKDYLITIDMAAGADVLAQNTSEPGFTTYYYSSSDWYNLQNITGSKVTHNNENNAVYEIMVSGATYTTEELLTRSMTEQIADLALTQANTGKPWMRIDSDGPEVKAIVKYSSETSVMFKELNSNDPGWTNYSIRQLIPGTALSASGSKIKVRFKGSTATNWKLKNASIVEQQSVADGTTTPSELLFSGASGFTVTAGSTILSDELTFTLDTAKNYLITMDFDSSLDNTIKLTGQTGFNAYYLIGSKYNEATFGASTLVSSTIYGVAEIITTDYTYSNQSVLLGGNNLSELTNTTTARNNLGLGSSATLASSAFTSTIISKTHAQMVTMKTGGTFAPGQWYEISDFQLKWRVPGDPTQIDSGSVEPLLVFAVSNNELFKIAYSKAYPEDEIIYELEDYTTNPDPADTTTQTRTGYISRRIDRMRDIDIGWDFRAIKWRAYKLDLSSIPTWSSATTYGKFTQAGTLAGSYAIYNNYLYYSRIASNIAASFNIDNWTLACPYDLSTIYFTGDIKTLSGRLTISPDKASHISQPTFTNSLTSAGTDQSTNVYNMKIANGYSSVFYSTSAADAPHDNYIYSEFIYNTFSYNFYNNMLGNQCYNNVAGYNFHDNSFDGVFTANMIGTGCHSNIVGVKCYNNLFGTNFQNNYFGISCYGNTIGDEFHLNSNTNNFYSNTIGNQFHHNNTGSFYINVVGDLCVGNEIGGSCYYNVIGNGAYSNTIGLNFASNTISDAFQYNDVKTGITADFTSASHVYATYNCQLFKNYSGTNRLSYYNAADSLVITDITN